MDSADPKSTKQRKLAAGQDDRGAKGRSALRALRLGLARAARDVLELPCAVIGATQARMMQEDVPAALGEDRLLILIDGPERAVGVIGADRGCLTALIQQQTMSRVTGGEAAQRVFTPTDAAMLSPLINGALQRAADLSEIPADRECLTGYRFGAKADDMRAVVLALEAERFRVFDLTIDFDSGKMQGRMTLALPEPEIRAEEDDSALAESRARLQRSVGAAQAEMTAVIGHLRLPLSKLGGMKPGDVLPLVHDKLNQADLHAIDGRKVTSVRLGQAGGWRAIRFGEAARRDLGALPAERDFDAGALPAERAVAAGGKELPAPVNLPVPAAMPAAMPSPGAIDLPGFGEDGASTGGRGDSDGHGDGDGDGAMGFPAMPDDIEPPLPDMSPEDAAAEISELAGLDMGAAPIDAGGPDLPAPDLDLPVAEAALPLPNAG